MTSGFRMLLVIVCLACGLLYILAWWVPVPGALSGLSGYACLGVLPGLALMALLGSRRFDLEGQITVVGLSPVAAGVAVALLLQAGMTLPAASRAACAAFAIVSILGLALRARPAEIPSESGAPVRVWIVAATAVALLLVFPCLGEVSRMRSDAWFHSAIVSELTAFGLPLTDPYFAGMPLQYMWLYHAYVGALALATGLEPSWAMALVNLQALVCLVLATFAITRSLRGDLPGGIASSAFMLAGLNCLFWSFLPLKLLRAAFGQVRGWDEVTRQLAILPLEAERTRALVSVWRSQAFLLDKFIVATAFSLGLCLAVAFFFFALKFIADGRAHTAALASCSVAGLVLYHTPAGVATTGAMALALLLCAATSPALRRRALALFFCMAGIGLLTLPYLYSVSSGKETEQLIPIGVSLPKTSAILISCAAALLLGMPWVARFLKQRETPQYFYGLLALSSLFVALVIVLPGPNVYDKPPYFAFLPLAPLAGWSLHWIYRRGSTRARRTAIAVLLALAIAPNTALLYTAYVLDPGPERLQDEEREMYEWIGENTPRDGVFLENGERVGMLVLGPRRLIWGHDSYAYQWGYKKDEMDRRRSLRDKVFSGRELTSRDAGDLAGFGDHVYIVVRREDFGAAETAVFDGSPYLSLEYSDRCANIYRVGSRAPD